MKKMIAIGSAAMVCAGLIALAATPNYTRLSDGGNASAPAEVIFKADPSLQIRLVGVNWESDTNNAALSFTTGTGAYVINVANTNTTGVTQAVNSVTGLAASDVLILQKANGACYAASLSSTNNGTNAVLATGGWGVATAVGDSVYKMSDAETIRVGATTNAQNGEAIYVGNYGRPVRVVLTPALATNRLSMATARYE